MRGAISLGAALGAGTMVVLATCAQAPRMPAVDGAVVEVRRSDGGILAGEAGYGSTLQLWWFGSGCHVVQLGDAVVLTDPFVTNELRLGGMRSDPERVAETLGRMPVPCAVLVNHSHHDHILDGYAAMSLESWRRGGVPLYGGRSCKNLLAGWGDGEVLGRCHVVPDGGGKFPVRVSAAGYSAEVTAYRTEHSPHLKCGFTLSNGLVREPRKTPPESLFHFQTGEAFNYLIELRGPGGVSYNVFYLGAPYHLDERPESLPPAGTRIDVAIVLAPSAKNVRGYPAEHLGRLRARHVVLSHFNTFVREDPDEQLSLMGKDLVKMPELMRDVQAAFAGEGAADYPEFEKLHIPAVTRVGADGRARNVVQIR